MATLGIDATNLRDGGGLTHLLEFTRNAAPCEYGFDRMLIWGGEEIEKLDAKPWLEKRIVLSPADSYLRRTSWARRQLEREFRVAGCDLLFCPGGSFCNKRIPYVSMSRNMLLYDDIERQRFPWGWNRLRYNLLRTAQRHSFWYSKGNIFVSQYAFRKIAERFPFVLQKPNTIIYHGVDNRFAAPLKRDDSHSGPLRLLYVSRINYYKHQWNVVEAVKKLNRSGHNIQLRLVGQETSALHEKLAKSMAGISDDSVVVTGHIPYGEIQQEYLGADAFVFASTCENMPNILVEAMCAGLPIACSDYGPMPEILADAGIYFDPLSIESIESALGRLVGDCELRVKLSKKSLERATRFSWQRTASETLGFLQRCLHEKTSQ